jgi:hypothetical protein
MRDVAAGRGEAPPARCLKADQSRTLPNADHLAGRPLISVAALAALAAAALL